MAPASSVRKGVVAAQDVLDQYEVVDFESVDPSTKVSTSGIKHRGWTFCTTHGKIANEAEGLALNQTISRRCGAESREDDVILLQDNHLHTPPMLFPHDSLVLIYDPPSASSPPPGQEGEKDGGSKQQPVQTRVEFNVLDALSCWAVQHRAPDHAAFIPEVPFAHKWQPQKQDGSTGSGQEKRGGGATGIEDDKEALPVVAALQHQEFWDWTYSTPYSCTTFIGPAGTPLSAPTAADTSTDVPPSPAELSYMFSGGVPLSHSAPSRALTSSAHPLQGWEKEHLWQPSVSSGINMDMLRRQDQPILFFDEVLLYQDDLEDCGESAYDVKVRVMPMCWFVLARLFTRVDGGRLVMRETRLFHEFGTDHIAMELTWRQCSETDFRLQQPRDLGGVPSSSGPLPPPGQGWRPPPPGSSAGRGTGSVISTISSAQLRDPNVMSTLMPALPPHCSCSTSSSSRNGEEEEDLAHLYGAVSQPVFQNYSLSL